VASQLKAHASTEVVYQRGLEQVTVPATIGKTEFDVDDGSGAVLRIQSRDYLIHTSDLVLGGSQTVPQSGEALPQLRAAQLSQDDRWNRYWSSPCKHRRAAGSGRLGQAT